MPTVLITGGTRGIGLALGRAFARKGWKVGACYHRDEASAGAAALELASLSEGSRVDLCDVTRPDQVGQWTKECLDRWGSLDCVIHNAGATWNARLLNVEEEQWGDTLQVHLKGAFLLAKACLRPMLRREGGHFIFVSSVVASSGNIGQGSYTAAKAGLVGFARSLALEYGAKNIRSNVVYPGFHKTRLADNLSPEAEEAIRKRHLLGRTADLGEVAEFTVWLAGTKNISGQVFNLDSRLPGWL